MGKLSFLAVLAILSVPIFAARPVSNRYALILEDPPVSERFTSRETMRTAEASSYRSQIRARHTALRGELSSRGFVSTGETDTLLNAVFVLASKDRAAELATLPGVAAVVPLRYYKPLMNKAVQLVNASGAWNALGGISNAGAGVKIAILDTGIDQTHPAFQDSTLTPPAGFPICSGSDCSFTNNKVIVARSYVRQLSAGTSSLNPAADSRPDDNSPRDHTGHGTAVASVAAGETNTSLVTFNGMAPKAFLGNYRIFGSPEVNDTTADDVIISAVEDAMNDGMDIISLSLGGPALSGPLDTGVACGASSSSAYCDPLAHTLETAAQSGVIIVVAAGNEGENGNVFPTFSTIASPGDAPSVITAGATTNSHTFGQSVKVSGSSVPSNLGSVAAVLGDGPIPSNAVTAPGIDITKVGDNGLGCSALPAGSLTGYIVLIERGTCTFVVKVQNAQAAGAVGVIFYMADAESPIAPGGLGGTSIPSAMISNSDGTSLKSFLDSNSGHPVTIDPTLSEQSTNAYNLLATFSSQGPVTGTNALKPDLVAVGTNMYMAAENYDPLGILYSSTRYTVADGTSFATPMVSGAAALVKQAHPSFHAAQVKSALVNTATTDVTMNDLGNAVTTQSIGAGKLDAGAAVAATVTSAPPTISFGALTHLPSSQQITLTNNGTSSVGLTLANASANGASGVSVAISPISVTLAAGASSAVTVTLSGSVPAAGSYSGAITIQGQNVSMRVPYLYLVASGTAANIIPLFGNGNDDTVGDQDFAGFKLIDAYGLPVTGAHVTWRSANGQVIGANSATDSYGIAEAEIQLGSTPGTYTLIGSAAGQSWTFTYSARAQPNISTGGVINAGSAAAGIAVAPGSYISIYGTGLSDYTDQSTTARLPMAIDYVIVSFDVTSAGISVPGHLTYVSPDLINVQVPWELEGQSSVQMKVAINYSYSNLVTVSLSNYSPAFFETATNTVAALDLNYAVINSSHPAVRGQTIALYANGLGPVTNTPASGDPASSTNLSKTTTTPVVMIGGVSAPVSFSGLAPGFAGLYQINVTVPSNISAGSQPVTVQIGGQTSKTSGITVQ